MARRRRHEETSRRRDIVISKSVKNDDGDDGSNDEFAPSLLSCCTALRLAKSDLRTDTCKVAVQISKSIYCSVLREEPHRTLAVSIPSGTAATAASVVSGPPLILIVLSPSILSKSISPKGMLFRVGPLGMGAF